MVAATSTRLSPDQQIQCGSQGYCFPIAVFDESETAELRSRFLDYFSANWDRIKNLPAREHNKVLIETHTVLNWVYRIVSDPRVLDVAESILGANLLVWSSAWFPKMPGDKKYISWHQDDATYWGLHQPYATTAWIALSESVPENGCMRVIPRTHKGPLLPQVETYARDNALSRGQEIAVQVDESKAVDLVLRPGEMSLHHIGMVHGSKANESDKRRIGLAIRYISTDVVQHGTVQQCTVPLSHPAVAVVVPGCGSVSEVKENSRMVSCPLPVEFWTELRKTNLLPDQAPVPSGHA